MRQTQIKEIYHTVAAPKKKTVVFSWKKQHKLLNVNVHWAVSSAFLPISEDCIFHFDI